MISHLICNGIDGSCPPIRALDDPPPPTLTYDATSGGSIVSGLAIALALLFACLFLKKLLKRRSESARMRNYNDEAMQEEELPGLDKRLLGFIPVSKYSKHKAKVKTKECAVCLSSFEDDASIRMLPRCKHAFHAPCVDKWFDLHANCPLCREELNLHTIAIPTDHSTESIIIQAAQVQNLEGAAATAENPSAQIHVQRQARSHIIESDYMPSINEDDQLEDGMCWSMPFLDEEGRILSDDILQQVPTAAPPSVTTSRKLCKSRTTLFPLGRRSTNYVTPDYILDPTKFRKIMVQNEPTSSCCHRAIHDRRMKRSKSLGSLPSFSTKKTPAMQDNIASVTREVPMQHTSIRNI